MGVARLVNLGSSKILSAYRLVNLCDQSPMIMYVLYMSIDIAAIFSILAG